MTIPTPEGRVAVQQLGIGPAVLLLHGWEGQASDLDAFIDPLLRACFRVITMDLPAHGASEGRRSSIPEAARALRAVGGALGALHAVIAHSVGSPILVEALYAGLSAGRVVLVSAPAEYELYARTFANRAGLDVAATDAMLVHLRDAMGVDVREISLPRRAPYLRQPALFIHSGDDRVVAVEDSFRSASAWPGARHLRVEGLGHRRILSAPAVIDATIQFLDSQS